MFDLSLPDGSGYDLCKLVKAKKDIPVIFLTVVDDEVNVVMGLDMGADDYITKPFRVRELMSRINSVLRRYNKQNKAKPVIELGQLKINTLEGKVYKHGKEIVLTALEYRLLLILAGHAGQVLSRNQLLEQLWDVAADFVNDNTLTVYIKRPFLIPLDIKGLSVSPQGDKGATFLGDLNWTVEAVVNIIKNCIEHIPQGGALAISFTENALYTEIVIADNGKGIAKEDLPYVFQRFYKGKNAVEGSVGIGLAMSHSIITSELSSENEGYPMHLYLKSTDPMKTQQAIENMNAGVYIKNLYQSRWQEEQMILLLSVFTYGFIVLITAIAIANIFNTISTSIALRKREFAMLKSVGMTPESFNKMINYESIFYGITALLYGLPLSLMVMYLLYKASRYSYNFSFMLPLSSILTVMIAIFVIVGTAMLYAAGKVKKENIIDVLKLEIY